jgi:chemotaxis regulatin CheY-phosphate phosphatase CheZ
MPTIRGPVRARDLRANMKELGAQEGIARTLEQLLDEHVQNREHMRELAQMMERCIDLVQQMTSVGDEMRKRLEEFKRHQAQGDAIDHGNS